MHRIRTAVLISGRGSNLLSLLQAQRQENCPYDINLVVSNNAEAGGLKFAQEYGVESATFPNSWYRGQRQAQEEAIHALLKEKNVELIALAGYMRVLTPWLVTQWQGKIINIHPSLLPLYTGLHTHQRVLLAGDREHGCTVHYVTSELDAGPVILQARVPVMSGDTEETLSARVLAQEHTIYPKALSLVAQSLRNKE